MGYIIFASGLDSHHVCFLLPPVQDYESDMNKSMQELLARGTEMLDIANKIRDQEDAKHLDKHMMVVRKDPLGNLYELTLRCFPGLWRSI